MKTKTKIIGSFFHALILGAVSAFGHGSMADPISRSYEVFLENPETPTSEAAKAALGVGGTQPFYDWMEVRRQIPDYNYPAVIPDGKLPGVGLDKYAGLNLVRTDWPATKVVPGPKLCRFYATTVHDPSFFKAYITREGYNPREALRWADLVELPGAEATTLSGSNYYMTLNLPVRTGRHILYVIWQRIDPVGEVFFSTSDLDFGGVDYGVAVTPVTPPPASTALVDPTTHTHVDSAAVTFSYANQWTSGGQGLFHINNTSVDATRGWTLEFDYAGDITSLWEGVISSRFSNHYVIRNADYNGVIPTGGVVDVGFVANFTTAGLQPTNILFNGVSTTVPVLSVSNLALNSVTVGAVTSQTLVASGGTAPYSWSVTTGTLPAGLTLSSAGVLSGTPTMAGTSTFTVQAKDSVSAIATRAYGSAGAGSLTHLTAELFKAQTNTFMVHIPYRGIAPAITDLIGGQTQMMFPGLAAALPHIRSGRIRALAVTGNKRHPQVKDIPTLEESGLKGFDAQQWYGVVGPANMPAAIVKTLNDAMLNVLAQPDFKEKLSSEAVELMPMKPAEFAAYMKADLARWTQLAKARNIQLDS